MRQKYIAKKVRAIEICIVILITSHDFSWCDVIREKQQPPSLSAPRHPHGCSPAAPTHPGTGQARPLRMGNDNSSVVRQFRSQTQRPDPVPGTAKVKDFG